MGAELAEDGGLQGPGEALAPGDTGLGCFGLQLLGQHEPRPLPALPHTLPLRGPLLGHQETSAALHVTAQAHRGSLLAGSQKAAVPGCSPHGPVRPGGHMLDLRVWEWPVQGGAGGLAPACLPGAPHTLSTRALGLLSELRPELPTLWNDLGCAFPANHNLPPRASVLFFFFKILFMF